jgi:hypothetical protein
MVMTLINFIDNMIYHWKENFASFPTVYLASFYLLYKRSYSKKCSLDIFNISYYLSLKSESYHFCG